ncbi:tryptophan 2,3-dioxygenase [Xanthomonas axonopodis pv. begoniae]|nr:tryptophan 2,3-dioxygenase [Xanthomonas axonopodis pv. begoniae]MBO9770390.1 tryptophan 2,3-dioxygenase [Xanthomonas axonopodis pv. begoniae]PPT37973.1 tryptophan 2,3-dioxygenase [Xanthomonas axonopodis pv. begoniae]
MQVTGAERGAMNYWDYIKVEQLLSLQGGLGDDETAVGNDEALFIAVHQIYELWFKLILRELGSTRDLLEELQPDDERIVIAVRSLSRATAVFEQANLHFKLMETMTARDFLEFRGRLAPASGFQSAQLREIEVLLGLEDSDRLAIGQGCSFKDALRLPDGALSTSARRLEARIAGGPSLKQSLYAWLERLPIAGSTDPAVAERFAQHYLDALRAEGRWRLKLAQDNGTAPQAIDQQRSRLALEDAHAAAFLHAEEDPSAPAHGRAQRRAVRTAMIFVESYRELPQMAWPRELLEGVIALEQAMLIWRQRHARMVERFIGHRAGTGGSPGVAYLDQTALQYRVFSDLWTVRSLLLRKECLPSLDAVRHGEDVTQ